MSGDISSSLSSKILGGCDHIGLGVVSASRKIFGGGFYSDGWGDNDKVEEMYSYVKSCIIEGKLPDIDVSITKEKYIFMSERYIGRFESPLAKYLPDQIRTVDFLIEPAVNEIGDVNSFDDILRFQKLKAIALHCSGTADEYYILRHVLFAKPMWQANQIGSFVLTLPFYGRRRMPTQFLFVMRSVAWFRMQYICGVFETACLLSHIRKRLATINRISLPTLTTGMSMGGCTSFTAATIAACDANTRGPIGAIPCLGPVNPFPLSDCILFHIGNYDQLAKDDNACPISDEEASCLVVASIEDVRCEPRNLLQNPFAFIRRYWSSLYSITQKSSLKHHHYPVKNLNDNSNNKQEKVSSIIKENQNKSYTERDNNKHLVRPNNSSLTKSDRQESYHDFGLFREESITDFESLRPQDRASLKLKLLFKRDTIDERFLKFRNNNLCKEKVRSIHFINAIDDWYVKTSWSHQLYEFGKEFAISHVGFKPNSKITHLFDGGAASGGGMIQEQFVAGGHLSNYFLIGREALIAASRHVAEFTAMSFICESLSSMQDTSLAASSVRNSVRELFRHRRDISMTNSNILESSAAIVRNSSCTSTTAYMSQRQYSNTSTLPAMFDEEDDELDGGYNTPAATTTESLRRVISAILEDAEDETRPPSSIARPSHISTCLADNEKNSFNLNYGSLVSRSSEVEIAFLSPPPTRSFSPIISCARSGSRVRFNDHHAESNGLRKGIMQTSAKTDLSPILPAMSTSPQLNFKRRGRRLASLPKDNSASIRSNAQRQYSSGSAMSSCVLSDPYFFQDIIENEGGHLDIQQHN